MSLYVGNLHPDCNEAILYQKFSRFGKLLNIHVCRDAVTHQSLGNGYVNFCLQSDAEKALASLNHDLILGKPVRLMWTRNKNQEFNLSANLFIKNMHPDIDEKTLHDIFSSYGAILSLKIVKKGSEIVSAYGFVQFEEEDSAESAIRNIDGKLIRGQVISVSKYRPKKHQADKKFNNVYFKNFGLEANDEDLRDLCGEFGTILSAKVMTDENRVSKGFGFVSFKDPESAKAAVENLNGIFLGGRKLFAGRAKKKVERQKEVRATLLEKLRNCLQ